MRLLFKATVCCTHTDQPTGRTCTKSAEFEDKPEVPHESAEMFTRRAARYFTGLGWLVSEYGDEPVYCPDHS